MCDVFRLYLKFEMCVPFDCIMHQYNKSKDRCASKSNGGVFRKQQLD